ncbi:lysine--tRNA ligase [Candidatus Kaiserbacteria bacterium CG10_big_fil_rev_8_21_14_0_10_49_17]|uniref:Lysine--tRNA ligase n=1 Tax=Candidatus Kaiserbacteria bacterium CG10_big_fil_rev_8_21_14_0_10_49_17 TaxID=1974609 RepID=A0A2M6WE76_9BACT|nr:MAG: lysine--tRNA ligase [Candidatus Kaiserbacteria bacterium CG10_big_fil_rev_8_21_14_0_10_49_17]
MFWADKIVNDIREKLADEKNAKSALVIRDEKTASGPVHVGAMRGAALHGILSYILRNEGYENTYLYEINDFDAFDTVPHGVDESFAEHLGKPLFAVPSPDGNGNYAEHYGNAFARVIQAAGFEPHVYYSSGEYKAGKYNDVIKTALTRATDINRINKEVSGSEKDAAYLPLMVICEGCGKVATTRAVKFNGETVHYVCDQEGSGALGCGHEGNVSPYDGNAKLPWKVEWAAKFKVFDVDIEGEGKDLATKGGARDVANHICREVFKWKPPYDAPYEFLLVDGKKMSTSKGNAATAVAVSALMPSKIFRTLLLGRDVRRAINFDPSGDTIPLLFDQYDRVAQKYWEGADDDDARLFSLIHEDDEPEAFFLPRFSQIAYLVQMTHLSLEDEVAAMKGAPLTEAEKKELEERAGYAQRWLREYAPDDFKFELQKDAVPSGAQTLSPGMKTAIGKILRYIEVHEDLDGQELHSALHDIRKESGVEPAVFFSAIYQSFLGTDSGPKAGWFLSVLPREFLIERLEEVSK